MRFTVVCLLFGLMAGAPGSWAQVLYGSLVGNVKDASDAAIPDAKVTVKEMETGLSREASTGDAGQYLFPTLPGGRYEITVTRSGFSTYRANDVAVPVNTTTRMDSILKVGTVTESVQVEAAAPALQTDRAEVRAEIGARSVSERNFSLNAGG